MQWQDRVVLLAAFEVVAEHLEACEKRDNVDPSGLLPSDRLRGAITNLIENYEEPGVSNRAPSDSDVPGQR